MSLLQTSKHKHRKTQDSSAVMISGVSAGSFAARAPPVRDNL